MQVANHTSYENVGVSQGGREGLETTKHILLNSDSGKILSSDTQDKHSSHFKFDPKFSRVESNENSS